MEDFKDLRNEQIAIGWNSVDDAAREIYSGFNSRLLEGYPIFLYKSTSLNSDLLQVVVVQHLENKDKFAVSILTKTWSVVYPFNIPLNYLQQELFEILKTYKVEKSVLDVYNQIVNRL
jgi:hypothetical protein